MSKLKPSSDIVALYEHGVRHFGENYPQELEAKSKEVTFPPCPSRGHAGLRSIATAAGRHPVALYRCLAVQQMQTPRRYTLLYSTLVESPDLYHPLPAIPNLYAIETLSSSKSATMLHKALSSQSPPRSSPLNVYLQINTSGEDAKSGLPSLSPSSASPETSELASLALHILTDCPTLRLKGLMTIGSYSSSTSADPNPDFDKLDQSRKALLVVLRDARDGNAALGVKVGEIEADGLEMSCGMSGDYVQAIKQGSSSVRVGSKIFGLRPPRPS